MYNEKSETNLVIVAGGLNTRFNEYSRIPKILLPYKDNDSILIHNLNKIDHCDANIIIHRKYYEMVQNYVKVNNLKVSVFPIDNSDGSFWAIHEASQDGGFPENNVLFVWSDIIFEDQFEITEEDNDGTNIIWTVDGPYRYIASKNIVRLHEDMHTITTSIETGNVPGVYYFPYLKLDASKVSCKDNYDLVEYMSHRGEPFDIGCLGKIKEFRDVHVYKKELDVEPEGTNPRFFNKITINDNELTKECIDGNYVSLIDTEMRWYKEAQRLEVTNIPKIRHFGSHYMHMEYLKDYVPLDTYLRSTKDFDVFNEHVMPAVWKLHGARKEPVDSMRMLKDTKIEFYDKVLNRVGSIEKMILDFDYSEFAYIVHKSYTALMEMLDRRYGLEPHYVFSHGDLNGSNTMINPETKEVKFIDPRGYYGETKMLGLAEYDMAKLNYFLNGYDHFNNGFYMFASKDNFDAPECIYKSSLLDHPVYEIMLGFIYVNLSSYISNNVMKANISYHHGMNILKKALINYEQL